jgi:hypothetical protein
MTYACTRAQALEIIDILKREVVEYPWEEVGQECWLLGIWLVYDERKDEYGVLVDKLDTVYGTYPETVRSLCPAWDKMKEINGTAISEYIHQYLHPKASYWTPFYPYKKSVKVWSS